MTSPSRGTGPPGEEVTGWELWGQITAPASPRALTSAAFPRDASGLGGTRQSPPGRASGAPSRDRHPWARRSAPAGRSRALCFASLRLALPCSALICITLPCLASPCFALLYLALLCLALLFFTLHCLASFSLPCLALLRFALPCPALLGTRLPPGRSHPCPFRAGPPAAPRCRTSRGRCPVPSITLLCLGNLQIPQTSDISCRCTYVVLPLSYIFIFYLYFVTK